MKATKNHIIISLIAVVATNFFFVLSLIFGVGALNKLLIDGISFIQFVAIINVVLLMVAGLSIFYKDLGNTILRWGYSNYLRGAFLILLSVLLFIAASLILFGLHFALKNSFHLIENIADTAMSPLFIALTFYFLLVSTLMFFISNLERRSGDVFRLISQSMGNTLGPTLVDRGFMFIDLNDATGLAERLSSEAYANLLRDCFRMLNELVDVYPFEIYQYVGDEAVVTWKDTISNSDVLALDLFSDFKAYLEQNHLAFAKEYNVQPVFKCAIHAGEVVQSEIGKDVKHLVYHGDVLNTTARLLSQCHVYNTDIIISKVAITNRQTINQKYMLKPMTYTNLKGKEHSTEAYIVSLKPQSSNENMKQNTFFLNPKVTNSHSVANSFNLMKTIKNLSMLTMFSMLFISCGDSEKESKEEVLQKEQTEFTSESSVQVIRKSDLQFQTIKNGKVKSYLPITGRVIPKNTTQLVAEVQGRIIAGTKPFKAGTSFSKGQTILQIESKEFALNLEAQKSQFLNILTSMMPDLKADYPDNYQSWLTYVSNYESGQNLSELPETKSAPEKYFLTSRQVYGTFYTIKAQEERLGKFSLIAPFNGSLSSALVDNGGLVSPGQPLGTFISDTDYEIETAVGIALSQSLKVGQKIDFKSKGLDKIYTATVARINNIVDPSTQNTPVFLSINDNTLRSGIYLEGEVMLRIFDDAVNIPMSAINRDNTVHILSDGVIRKKPVEILSIGTTEATVKGLQDNSELILTTFDNPISGLKITE